MRAAQLLLCTAAVAGWPTPLPLGGEPEEVGEVDSALREWIHSISFDVPPFTLLGPWGIHGGSCSDTTVGRIAAEAIGGPGEPVLRYRISGIGVRCSMHDLKASLTINASLEDSSLDILVAPRPLLVVGANPPVELPFGPPELRECTVRARIRNVDFGGTSFFSEMLERFNERIREFFEKESTKVVCDKMRGHLAQRSAKLLRPVAVRLASLMEAPPPRPGGLATSELVDWGGYPPMLVGVQLLHEKPRVSKQLMELVPQEPVPWDTVMAALPDAATSTAASATLDALNAAFGAAGLGADEGVGDFLPELHIDWVQLGGLETLLSQALRGKGEEVGFAAAFEHIWLRMSTHLRVNPIPGRTTSQLHQAVNLTLSLTDVSVDATIRAMVWRSSLDNLFVDQMQQPSCLAQCARDAAPGSNASVGVVNLVSSMAPRLGVLGGSAGLPGFTGHDVLEADLAAALDVTLKVVLSAYLPAAQSLTRGAAAAALQRAMDTQPPCEATAIYRGPGDAVADGLLYGSGALVCLGLLGGWLASPQRKPTSPSGDVRRLGSGVHAGGRLASHPVVPRLLSVIYPVMVLSTVSLYLYADLCVATAINFVFTAHGQSVVQSPALAFSVVIIAYDAVQAGAYLIAGCIFCLSILWPFVKLLLLVFAWLATEAQLSCGARDQLLRALDEYGKFSLVDIWLGILALACYRLAWHSQVSDISFVVDPNPMMPFFMYIVATVLSLILGHLASGFHRRAANWDGRHTEGKLEEEDSVVALSADASRRTSLLLVFCLGLTAMLVVVGVQVKSFEMAQSGVLSIVLNEPDQEVTPYSLIDLGAGLTEGKSDPGLRMAQCVFFLFAMIIPVASVFVLLILWLMPLPLATQHLLLDLCKCLDAWAAFDVFSLTVAVSHFEFGLFSKFLMERNNVARGCAILEDILQTSCYHMECTLKPGFAICAAGGFASYVVPKLVLQFCQRSLERRGGAAVSDSGESDDDALLLGDATPRRQTH
eukprot:TRINITY_DN37507_c0_g1_i1.p1 TRINITY_DN37507_c0_g1~~TRINITY_DN37507_c0_g1_i1.p1  ORF type:complete len:994 (-),score=223.97 TRINITY_DN37507_c0_g1_i1:137-3118(-)